MSPSGFVLSHDDPGTAATGFAFVSGDIESAVATTKAASDKYVVILGAATAGQAPDLHGVMRKRLDQKIAGEDPVSVQARSEDIGSISSELTRMPARR
jgi:hypothetical protein